MNSIETVHLEKKIAISARLIQLYDLMIFTLFHTTYEFSCSTYPAIAEKWYGLVNSFLCKIMFTPLTYNYLLTSGDKNFASEFQYATYEICLFEHEKNDHKTNLRRKTEYHITRHRGVVCINRRSKGGLSENHSNFFHKGGNRCYSI